jgi:hypothetical protein
MNQCPIAAARKRPAAISTAARMTNSREVLHE